MTLLNRHLSSWERNPGQPRIDRHDDLAASRMKVGRNSSGHRNSLPPYRIRQIGNLTVEQSAPSEQPFKKEDFHD
jgi:hypothetical protein